MKLGGLFSGIGGFELAWQRQGGTVAWMCEIDPAARKVLEHRFPGVPIYDDVAQLDPAEVEPVDVVTGGSPCQGFSIAGARTGLEHVESRLFADYIRIVDGLAQRGLSYAVWENVPGVLSITNDDGQRTFPHVVAALVGADRPVHLNGGVRWNTGLADRGGRAVAWRVVDSRHFGVPQRRRRVYACVAFGGAAADRAGRALLAVPEGVRGDSAACSQAGQDLAGTLGGGAGSRGWAPETDRMTFVPEPFTFDGSQVTSETNRLRVGPGLPSSTLLKDSDLHVVETAACLTAGTGLRMDAETETLIPQTAHTLRGEGFDASEDGTGRGTPLVPQPVYRMTGGTGDESAFPEQQPALTASHGQPGNVAVPAVLLTMREGKDGGGKSPLISEDESLTLATGNSQVLFAPPAQGVDLYNGDMTGDLSLTLRSGASDGYGSAIDIYGVRRLTPVECERLQAFPDGWTAPAGSDSARYRALGNAITVNVAAWLFGRLP